MSLARREIVRVMPRGDLDDPRPELRINEIVPDHPQLAPHQRQRARFAPQLLVALVAGVNRNRRIAQHRLRPRGRDNDMLVRPRDRVTDVPEMPLLLAVFDLEIRQRRHRPGIPVDHVLAAIDEPPLPQPHEGLAHRPRQPRVHREALTRPVATRADLLELPNDRPAVLLLPFPDMLQEFLAPDLTPVDPLLAQMPFDQHLRRDAGMVGPREPEDVIAAHPPPAHRDVGHGDLEHVPHVERAGYIRRRSDQRVGAIALIRGDKKVLIDPPVGPFGLELARVINFL